MADQGWAAMLVPFPVLTADYPVLWCSSGVGTAGARSPVCVAFAVSSGPVLCTLCRTSWPSASMKVIAAGACVACRAAAAGGGVVSVCP